MNRPTTIRGLLGQVAKLHPKRSLAVALGIAALVIALGTPRRTPAPGDADKCPLGQAWFQGDVHYSQELVFAPDGNGLWTTGGAGGGSHRRVTFEWQSHGSTLTVVQGGTSRTVEFRTEPWDHISEGLCFIQFADRFLPDEQLATSYTNSP